jgi:hypothetical protein
MHYNHLILVFFVHLKFKRANMANMRNNEIMISNVNPEWGTSCFTIILEQKACVSWCCLKSHARSTITRCDKPDNWPILLTNIPTMQLLFRLAQLRTLRLTEEINVLLFYCRGTTFETRQRFRLLSVFCGYQCFQELEIRHEPTFASPFQLSMHKRLTSMRSK